MLTGLEGKGNFFCFTLANDKRLGVVFIPDRTNGNGISADPNIRNNENTVFIAEHIFFKPVTRNDDAGSFYNTPARFNPAFYYTTGLRECNKRKMGKEKNKQHYSAARGSRYINH